MGHRTSPPSQASPKERGESRETHQSPFLGSHSPIERDSLDVSHGLLPHLPPYHASKHFVRASSIARDETGLRRHRGEGEPVSPNQSQTLSRHDSRLKDHSEKNQAQRNRWPKLIRGVQQSDSTPHFYELLVDGKPRRWRRWSAQRFSRMKSTLRRVHKALRQNPRRQQQIYNRRFEREMDSIMHGAPNLRRRLLQLRSRNAGYARIYANVLDVIASHRVESRQLARARPRSAKMKYMQIIRDIDKRNNPDPLSVRWNEYMKHHWPTEYWEEEIAKRREQLKRLGMPGPLGTLSSIQLPARR